MSFQRLQDTDGFILIEFGQHVKPFLHRNYTKEDRVQFVEFLKPFLRRLMANGNSGRDSMDMLGQVVKLGLADKEKQSGRNDSAHYPGR